MLPFSRMTASVVEPPISIPTIIIGAGSCPARPEARSGPYAAQRSPSSPPDQGRYARGSMARRRPSASGELFQPRTALNQPLADRMRPARLEEIVGQEHLLGPGKLLSQMVAAHRLHSMILWGPPGAGKTTLAVVLAAQSGALFRRMSAVTAGIADLRAAVEQARLDLDAGKQTVLFIDEIHRWNRAQQDAFLPHVESGLITLIGATTENPSFEVIAPLLSRARVLVLDPLSEDAIRTIVVRALREPDRGLGTTGLELEPTAMDELLRFGAGDAQRALNTLEIAAELTHEAGAKIIGAENVREARQRPGRRPLLDDADGGGGRGSTFYRAPHGDLRLRGRRQC